MDSTEVFKNQFVKIYIEEGVLFMKYNVNTHIDLSLAKEIVRERLKLSRGASYPVCIDLTNVVKVDDDVLTYFSEGDSVIGISVGALIIRTGVSRLITTLFLMVKKPPITTKLFTNEASALRWLEHFKEDVFIH